MPGTSFAGTERRLSDHSFDDDEMYTSTTTTGGESGVLPRSAHTGKQPELETSEASIEDSSSSKAKGVVKGLRSLREKASRVLRPQRLQAKIPAESGTEGDQQKK